MKIFDKINDIKKEISRTLRFKKTIGFVPTMGFLHQGHLSLVEAAVEENDFVVVSIFVNPTQFGPDEDYDTYPRNIESDVNKLKRIGVDCIFAPDAKEMYPEGCNTFVEVKEVTNKLCGVSRPHFFRGVTTVVSKLFNIIRPNRAYFGRKDFQQLVVIRQMVKDLNMPVEIVGLPIVREDDGLAFSSRNKYLGSKEREQAVFLYQSLQEGRKMIIKQGITDVKEVKEKMISMIESRPLAKIDYVEIVEPETLEDLKKIKDKALLALAVYIGNTRLIDNMLIEL